MAQLLSSPLSVCYDQSEQLCQTLTPFFSQSPRSACVRNYRPPALPKCNIVIQSRVVSRLPQLSGNGREDGQVNTAEINHGTARLSLTIDNQQKSGVSKQSLKKKGREFAARRTKERSSRAEEER
jgi:hypothetical protein